METDFQDRFLKLGALASMSILVLTFLFTWDVNPCRILWPELCPSPELTRVITEQMNQLPR